MIPLGFVFRVTVGSVQLPLTLRVRSVEYSVMTAIMLVEESREIGADALVKTTSCRVALERLHGTQFPLIHSRRR